MLGANPLGWIYLGQNYTESSGSSEVDVPFIASVTAVFGPTLNAPRRVSQLAIEVLDAGTPKALLSQLATEVLLSAAETATGGLSQLAVEVLVQVLPGTIDVPFIPSAAHAYGVFSLFSDIAAFGPGNGGESFPLTLAPNGTTVTATLTAALTATGSLLSLSGDSGLPAGGVCLLIGSEVVYALKIAPGQWRIRGRALSNTAAATHSIGASALWTDSYDMAVLATNDVAESFTANITGSGSISYPGWLICFDSTQAYLTGSRYPMHVSELLGVFDAGAGSSGANRVDAAQPNAVCTPTGTSDDCPAALSNPARLQADVLAGDVALLRYTNAEASELELGSRSAALQSWFGIKRVDASDVDVTFTDPTGHAVDGTANGEFHNPLGPGIAPDTGAPTDHDVPYTTVTLPGTDRTFTYGPPRYSEKGWPICALAVRQGSRRVPRWASWDWRDFNYVYSGFDVDATFCQLVVNRNGLVFGSSPTVTLPGSQDIDGPDVVWDDGSYYFGVSWYVAIWAGPYLVIGPSIGGAGSSGGGGIGSPGGVTPTVSFPTGPGSPVVTTPTVEGGAGGGIPGITVAQQRFDATLV